MFAIDRQLIKDGYISERKHSECDYFIYNYTSKTQYEQFWNEQTLNCRGLILDSKGNVIARPFPKFFNVGEYNQHSHLGKIPNYRWFDIWDKLDGSLGILYKMPAGEYRIATRGSFESAQAQIATKILKEKYSKPNNFYDGFTYLFEIIYPENRIVVDYGKQKDLILLAVIDKQSRHELSYEELLGVAEHIGCPLSQYYGRVSFKNQHTLIGVKHIIREGAEGFVLKFNTGLRVKIKSEEYCRLHKLVTGLSNKSIWELLKDGKNLEDSLQHVPDEFYDWAKETRNQFIINYNSIEHSCSVIVDNAKKFETRKEVAEFFKGEATRDYLGVCFAIYDDKEYADLIWKMLKPKYSKPFREDL